MGGQKYGIDPAQLEQYAQEIRKVKDEGLEGELSGISKKAEL